MSILADIARIAFYMTCGWVGGSGHPYIMFIMIVGYVLGLLLIGTGQGIEQHKRGY